MTPGSVSDQDTHAQTSRQRGTRSISTSKRSSRRSSQLMGPPPLPLGFLGGQLPPGGIPYAHPNPVLSAMGTRNMALGDTANFGPVRHPRPLTTAELHSQMEQENEAIVNRLNRELSQLHAKAAHLASNAFATSTQSDAPATAGLPPSCSDTRQRSSSNVSGGSTATAGTTGVIAGSISCTLPTKKSTSSHPKLASTNSSSASFITSPRLEEIQFLRNELEAARRENEVLRQKIKELEKRINSKKRSDSFSSTASTSGFGNAVHNQIRVLPDRTRHRNVADSAEADESAISESSGDRTEDRD